MECQLFSNEVLELPSLLEGDTQDQEKQINASETAMTESAPSNWSLGRDSDVTEVDRQPRVVVIAGVLQPDFLASPAICRLCDIRLFHFFVPRWPQP